MYYINNTSDYLINVCIITVIWKQKADQVASGTSLRGMAKQPGFTSFIRAPESSAGCSSTTTTEGTRDGAAERVAGPLSKASFAHRLYPNFK